MDDHETPTAGVLATLVVVSTLELITLTLLLGNLVTVDSAQLVATVGPTHGACYLVVVVIVLLTRGFGPRARWLAPVPGVGGAVLLTLVSAELRRRGRSTGRA